MDTFIYAFVIFYFWHALGVTVGYHRLLAHRTFTCNKLAEYFWVLGGYLCFEGSPIWWATVHRNHHRNTDNKLDSHAPKYGWKDSYFGWIFNRKTYPAHIDPQSQAKDLINDPLYRFLERSDWSKSHVLALTIGLLFRILLLVFFGWKIALASLAAGVFVLQIPLFLNVVCHIPKLGYKNFDIADDSVNVWWVAIFTNGEGWHNNHHAHPGSARSGLRPHEIDVSWMTIRLMRAVGLASCVHEAKPIKRRETTKHLVLNSERVKNLETDERLAS
ncbi:MAG: fatty acid desaturase [Cyanobacteria bacterium SZAS-4]|nr:fatty acid desaturase [Cyanobacteria bacterium SZAS-4]